MLVGHRGGLRPPRVHHHRLASPPAQLGQAPAHPGRAEQAAVGSQRIGAHDQEPGRVVDVRDRQQPLVPIEEPRDEHARQLVHRAGREAGRAAEARHEERAEDHGAVIVDGGIAHVDGDRGPSVQVLDALQPRRGLVEGFLPADLFPIAAAAPQRSPQPVRILVDLAERLRLDAQKPAAERVLRVAADGPHLAFLVLDDEPAHRLTEVAGAVVERHGIGYASGKSKGKTVGCPPWCQGAFGCGSGSVCSWTPPVLPSEASPPGPLSVTGEGEKHICLSCCSPPLRLRRGGRGVRLRRAGPYAVRRQTEPLRGAPQLWRRVPSPMAAMTAR